MNKNLIKRISLFIMMILGIIVLDQVTKNLVVANFNVNESKTIIDGLFNFTYVRNPGAAFGFLANVHDAIRKPLIFFVPIGACFLLIFFLKQVWRKNFILEIAYSMIFAGAVGNLIDRFSLNYVIDFFDFYFKSHHFPAFNIADSSISIAAGLLILDLIIATIKKNKKDVIIKATDNQ